MSWTSLSQRLHQLPLILAGPILRRTEPDAVTVWVALQEPCQVHLHIYDTAADQGYAPQDCVLSGSSQTIALGQSLHLVAITARSPGGDRLKPDRLYAYDLTFERQASHWRSSALGEPISSQRNLRQALNSGHTPQVSISYFDHGLPTFALPPQDLHRLKLVHGSCRKAQGGGRDALTLLDGLIAESAGKPSDRPHQLFMTGDQIYGDDVADPLLWALTDAGEALLGWDEALPMATGERRFSLSPKQLAPGQRSEVAEIQAGFTAGLRHQPERAQSHLFSLGEYAAAYLMLWSPVIWPMQFPAGETQHQSAQAAQSWDYQVAGLEAFVHTLNRVRRALANTPTYMIFDDHDISDDWYLNRAWCDRVLGKPLGRRVVQNGLLVYALFQAWGNTPNQFQGNQTGAKLLAAAQAWSASGGNHAEAERAIAQYLGLPATDPKTGLPHFRQDGGALILDHHPASLRWHYTVQGPCHEVLVLDTRTWRGYPSKQEAIAPPALLSPTAFKQQISQPLAQTTPLYHSGSLQTTFVVAPTNLITMRLIDAIQQRDLQQGNTFDNDVGDAWNVHKPAFSELLAVLFEQRQRVIVLSGDIHYGNATRLHYWSRSNEQQQSCVLAQLTASAFKNEEFKTRLAHTKLKSIILEQPETWLGWQHPPDLLEIQTVQGQVRITTVPVPQKGAFVKQLYYTQGNPNVSWALAVRHEQCLPDWQYRTEWLPRQPAQVAPWGKDWHHRRVPINPKQGPLQRFLQRSIQPIWHSRWLQEGRELVGYNNLGVVRFAAPQHPQAAPTVVQDLYWFAPWDNSVVFSRFQVSLASAHPPAALPVIGKRPQLKTQLTAATRTF